MKYDVRQPLENLLVTTSCWQHEEDQAWLSIDSDRLKLKNQINKLIRADTSLSVVCRRQQEQIIRLKGLFKRIKDDLAGDKRLMKLFEESELAQGALKQTKEQYTELDDDEVT